MGVYSLETFFKEQVRKGYMDVSILTEIEVFQR